jgi:hypothetical protein
VLLEAQSRSKAARRALARVENAERATKPPRPKGGGQADDLHDDEAKVPMPIEGEGSGVEFW